LLDEVTMNNNSSAGSGWSNRKRKWLDFVAVAGIAWNLFGGLPFARTVTSTEADLIASGMTAEQAASMLGYPIWVTVVFALGVASGVVGSVLLLMRNRFAKQTLGFSLVMYVALWLGYAVYGVFAVFGTPQIVTMTVVVAIAVLLFSVSLKLTSQPAVAQG
jgi:hypothetical protein